MRLLEKDNPQVRQEPLYRGLVGSRCNRMSERVQHNRPTRVAMYSDCELTTGFPISSAGNSRIVTAHLPQGTRRACTVNFLLCVSVNLEKETSVSEVSDDCKSSFVSP